MGGTNEVNRKLREYVDRQRDEYNNHNVSFVWQLNTIADEIEAEIADRFIELPIDADGAPWTLEIESFVDDTGIEVVFSGLKVDYKGRWKLLSNCVWHDPSLCRHVKPDPLKELLDDVSKGINCYPRERITGYLDWNTTTAEAVMLDVRDRLRELLGGEGDKS